MKNFVQSYILVNGIPFYYFEDVAAIMRNRCIELGIYLMRIPFGNISEQHELGSHVRVCTHPDNSFPVYIESHDSC